MDDSGKEINVDNRFDRARTDNLVKYIKVGDIICNVNEIQCINCDDFSCKVLLRSRKNIEHYSRIRHPDSYMAAKKIYDVLSKIAATD